MPKKTRNRDLVARRRRTGNGNRSAPASPRPALITLLTDFGTADYFVGAMKGVVLSINPKAHVIDITHEIPPQDIETAAFTLLAAYTTFPAGTIHVAVVDPGVGSGRRPILVQTDNYCFVGPDNGIFSYVCNRESARSFHLNNDNYFRAPLSTTFHGRDIFAPVAAALSRGVEPSKLGVDIDDAVQLASLNPVKLKNGGLKGRIIHIDRFGNCITNLTRAELTDEMMSNGAKVTIAGRTIRSFRRFFAEQPGVKDGLFAIWGSAGFLEIASENCSAAKLLRVRRGQSLLVSRRK